MITILVEINEVVGLEAPLKDEELSFRVGKGFEGL